VVPGVNLEGGWWEKVQKLATKLVKYSLKQRVNTAIVGEGVKLSIIQQPIWL